MNSALKRSVKTILKSSIEEDKTFFDITSKSLLDSSPLRCELLFKENGILCGTKIIEYAIKSFNKKINISWDFNEGDYIKNKNKVGTIVGPANLVLSFERILLNFLQKTCGIATTTFDLSRAIKNKKIKLLDTRKTTPGWRLIEKYCVVVGGGENHRMNLSELILIKDNHILACGNLNSAMTKIIKKRIKAPIEVEVKFLSQVEEALKFKIKRIMLDNFSISNIKKAILMIRKSPGVEIEVSGGIDKTKIKNISHLDIDYISVGALTHSSPSIDISMNVLK